MECSFRAELNEHRYYGLNPTGTLNIRGHPIVPLYVVQLYRFLSQVLATAVGNLRGVNI